MIYTALGDSITFGENASSFAKAYPHLVVSQLNSYSRSQKVKGYVLARSGWSSSNLLDAVKGQGSSLIRHSDVISVWIGGVDLANGALLALKNEQPIAVNQILTPYRRNLHAILAYITNESDARIICCTQYNPFPNSSLAVAGISQLNGITYDIAQKFHANIAPVHTWFEGRQSELVYGYQRGKIEDALSGSMPIHPNDSGHRVIATGLTPYLTSRH